MRLQPARPVALPCLLPLGRLLHLGRGEMVERHVFAVTAGAAEAAGAHGAPDGAEGRDVLPVLPLRETGLEFWRDRHHGAQEAHGNCWPGAGGPPALAALC